MCKRTVGSSLLAGILLLVLVQHYSVGSARYSDGSVIPIESIADDAADADVDGAQSDSSTGTKKKGGNGFVRVISAPFRAIGRLFGGGKKNDQQLSRISDKDAKRFGSTIASRITDAENPAPAEPSSTEQLSPKEVSEKRVAAQQQAISSALSLYIMRGRAAIDLGDLDGAISELSRAASLDPKNAQVRNLLGVAFEGKGMRQPAVDSFQTAVRLSKDNAQYLNNYGFLLYRNGDLEAATKYLKLPSSLQTMRVFGTTLV
jgi:tetratricopeptide (TPR) repeat protein